MNQKKNQPPVPPIVASNPIEVAAAISEMHGYIGLNSVAFPDLPSFLAALPDARKLWMKSNKDTRELGWQRKGDYWRNTQYSLLGSVCFVSKLTETSLAVALHTCGGQNYGKVSFEAAKTPDQPMSIHWDIDHRKVKNWDRKTPKETGAGYLMSFERALGIGFVVKMPPVIRQGLCRAHIFCYEQTLDLWTDERVKKINPADQASIRRQVDRAAEKRTYYTQILVGDFSSI